MKIKMSNKIALFSDVHSNIAALEAVFEDIKFRNIEEIYCLGDLVGYSPFPDAVIELIQKSRIPVIIGNHDEMIAFSEDNYGKKYIPEQYKSSGDQAVDWTIYNTKKENKEFLKTLHKELEIKLDNYKILLVHGSPNSNNEYLFTNRTEEFLEDLLIKACVDVIIIGHTHIPYHRILSNNKHAINTGSVGKPHDGDPGASYVILEVIDKVLNVKLIKVPYDFESTAKAIENSDLPSSIAEIIRTGKK